MGDEALQLRILDVPTAKASCLKRQAWDDWKVPQSVLDGMKALFGEPVSVDEGVRRIVQDVRHRGDEALVSWAEKLDKCKLSKAGLQVSREQIMAAYSQCDTATVDGLELAAKRVEAFYRRQPAQTWIENNEEGTLGQLIRPIENVGIYVPGGTAPLPSSVIMTAMPAKVAGCKFVCIITPPQKDTGLPHPAILVAADIVKADAVYVSGGAQAIAALAYGTETVRKVDKIAGPGNLFVTLAKRQVFGMVGIDGLPGPTETMVVADDTADPELAAADLLAQAEHDVMASATLLTPSRALAEKVREAAAKQAKNMSRRTTIEQAFSKNSSIVLTKDLDEAFEIANEYAAEHLCLLVKDPWEHVNKINNAGGIFLGEQSFEVLGDYVAGPSHTMPTGGTARFASPVNVWDFVKIVSLIGLNEACLRKVGPAAAKIAQVEGLEAHANAVLQRLKRLPK